MKHKKLLVIVLLLIIGSVLFLFFSTNKFHSIYKQSDSQKVAIKEVDNTTIIGATVVTVVLPDSMDGNKCEVTVVTKDKKKTKTTYYEKTKKFVGSLDGTYEKADLSAEVVSK